MPSADLRKGLVLLYVFARRHMLVENLVSFTLHTFEPSVGSSDLLCSLLTSVSRSDRFATIPALRQDTDLHG